MKSSMKATGLNCTQWWLRLVHRDLLKCRTHAWNLGKAGVQGRTKIGL